MRIAIVKDAQESIKDKFNCVSYLPHFIERISNA